MVSPALYAEPSGFSHVRLLSGQASMNLRLLSMACRCPRPQRKSTLRVLDRAPRDLLETHRPPALEHRERRVHHARDDRRIEADAVQVLAATVYQSIVAPFGAQPCPTIEVTLRSRCG